MPLDTKLMRQFLKDLGLAPGRRRHRLSRARAARGAAEPQSAAAAKRGLRHCQPGLAQGSRCAAAQGRGREEKAAQPDRGRNHGSGRTAAVPRRTRPRQSRAAGTSASAGSPQNPDESARAMRPSELGSKSFFSDIFSSFSDKGETGTFNGEPARESLTAPPAGYQTPSPAQPYGLAPNMQRARQRRSKTAPRELAKRRRTTPPHSVPVALHPSPTAGAVARSPARMRAVRSLVGHHLAQTPDHLGRACSCRKRACRRCRDRLSRCAADQPFHPVQRSRGRGHSRSPRAGRHPHGLVPGRLRRRDAGQVRARPFPRTSDVQGHRQEPVRACSPRSVADHRRPGERLHLQPTTPAISSGCRASKLKAMMEFEADRMTGLALTDDVVRPELNGRAGRAEHAGRQQSRARGSANRWMPRSTSTIPMAGR